MIQRTYAGAMVTNVTVMGETETARAEFSNGQAVTFQKDVNDEWKVVQPGGKRPRDDLHDP